MPSPWYIFVILPCCFLERGIILSGCICFLGFVRVQQIPNIPPISDTQAIVFEVDQLPVKGPKVWTFRAQAIAYRTASPGWKPIYTTWKITMVDEPRLGARYVARARLKPFRSALFPDEMDWGAYFRQQGIQATAFIGSKQATFLSNAPTPLFSFQPMQAYFMHFLERAMPPGVNRDVAQTMLLGAKSDVDFDTMQRYSALGAIHILSVSGMHIGLLYLGLTFLLTSLKRKKPFIFFVLMLLILWLYAGISGFSAPVLRAAWMFSVMLVAKTFRLQQHPINTLAFACFVLLVVDPVSLFQAGFQLSFGAVLGLILFQESLKNLWQLRGIGGQIWELSCVAISAQLLTWPLIIFYFHQFPNPIIFFLLNPLLILLSSCALGIGFLFIAIAPVLQHISILFQWLGFILDGSFSVLHTVMFWVTDHFNAVIPFLWLDRWEIGLYLFLFSLCMYWLRYRTLWTLWLANTCLLCWILFEPPPIQHVRYLTVLKGQVAFVELTSHRAFLLGFNEPKLIQSHVSALFAHARVRDTIVQAMPNYSFSWQSGGKRFLFVKAASAPPSWHVDGLILDTALCKKDLRWLNTWQNQPIYFAKTPSPYRLAQIKKSGNYMLADIPAIRL